MEMTEVTFRNLCISLDDLTNKERQSKIIHGYCSTTHDSFR